MTKRDALDAEAASAAKRPSPAADAASIESSFSPKIWRNDFQQQIEREVAASQPYRWGTIRGLIDDTLLRQVRREVLSEIAFTKKETDIYKVYQSGDLANMSGLDWDDLSRLPALWRLRSALYSPQFRRVVSRVTGCGALSGTKTDMSINTYNSGCHLLTHDDVIGSRRVSFILYLPEPDREWKPQYGGALRLFPSIVPNVPHPDPSCKLVPQFNQIAFFTVQPGLSFHDVEEVRVDRQRLSIQGWYHIPQEGEEGFVEGEERAAAARSTLQQLERGELEEYDFPKGRRTEVPSPASAPRVPAAAGPDSAAASREACADGADAGADAAAAAALGLSRAQLEYLRAFLNPAYLDPATISRLHAQFSSASIVELASVLRADYAAELLALLRREELDGDMPTTAAAVAFPWQCALPPHKQRFMYLDGATGPRALDRAAIEHANSVGPREQPNFALVERCAAGATARLAAVAAFLRSAAFHQWLYALTGLVATADQVLVRRFRPGHDFILATTTDTQLARDATELNVLLEATLNLTPTATNARNWGSGEFGGYELCMAGDAEGADDPAVYRRSDTDSVLYTSQCQWNTLCLMVRDPSVMKFVKYVSINAKGSRWDVSCQWNVRDGEEDDGDEGDESGFV